MVTRAIDPLVCPVRTSVPGTRNAAPTATTAPMTMSMASTRQKVSLRRIRRRSTMVSASSDMAHLLVGWVELGGVRLSGLVKSSTQPTKNRPRPAATRQSHARTGRNCGKRRLSSSVFVLLVRGLVAALERGPEDVAERCTGVRGAVLRDRLLLLGHLERLDRDLHLVGAAVELND